MLPVTNLSLVAVTLLGAAVRPAIAQPTAADRAGALTAEMRDRGEPAGEIHLAVAAIYARDRGAEQSLGHLKAARRLGVARSRVNLVLADLYRRQGRYDAALSTLVRLLVRHREQPHALVQLWKTIYELTLRGAKVQTDIAPIREQLAASGLYFPPKVDFTPDAQARSAKLTAAGYSALLGRRDRLAADLFREAIDALPSSPRAHRGLGIALARRHDAQRAAGAYLLYLELHPRAPDAAEVDKILMRYWRRAGQGPQQ